MSLSDWYYCKKFKINHMHKTKIKMLCNEKGSFLTGQYAEYTSQFGVKLFDGNSVKIRHFRKTINKVLKKESTYRNKK